MYKTTSRNMQKASGIDVCARPKKKPRAKDLRWARNATRKRWALTVQRTVREQLLLPVNLPQWLEIEIKRCGVKKWLDRYVPKLHRLKKLTKLKRDGTQARLVVPNQNCEISVEDPQSLANDKAAG